MALLNGLPSGGFRGNPIYQMPPLGSEVAPAPVSVAGAQDAVAPQASGKRKYVSLTRDIARQKKLAEALSRMGAEEGSASTVGGITAPMSALGPLVRGLTSFGGSYLSGKAEGDMDAATDEEQAAVDARIAEIFYEPTKVEKPKVEKAVYEFKPDNGGVSRLTASGFDSPTDVEVAPLIDSPTLSARERVAGLTQLAGRSDIGKEAAGLYMPIVLSDLERERELADTDAANVAAQNLYNTKTAQELLENQTRPMTDEELARNNLRPGTAARINTYTGEVTVKQSPLAPPTPGAPPNLSRGDIHRLVDGTKVRAIFDPATGGSFYMQGGNRIPLPDDAVPITAGAGQVTYQNMIDLREDYSATDTSIAYLDDFLNTVEKSGVGLDRFANEVSGNLQTLFKGNEPLTEGQLNAALAEGKLNRLLGMFRIETVGPGAPSNYDMERIVKSLVGQTSTTLQNPQVIKALVEDVREGKRLRLERLKEDFQFMVESGSLGNFRLPPKRSTDSPTPSPATAGAPPPPPAGAPSQGRTAAQQLEFDALTAEGAR